MTLARPATGGRIHGRRNTNHRKGAERAGVIVGVGEADDHRAIVGLAAPHAPAVQGQPLGDVGVPGLAGRRLAQLAEARFPHRAAGGALDLLETHTWHGDRRISPDKLGY